MPPKIEAVRVAAEGVMEDIAADLPREQMLAKLTKAFGDIYDLGAENAKPSGE